jgi:hypothetical protein
MKLLARGIRKFNFQILKLGRGEASGKRNKKILIFKYSNWEEAKLLAKRIRKF